MHFVFVLLLTPLFAGDSYACTKKGCVSQATIQINCGSKCPEQVRAFFDGDLIFDSCVKDAFKIYGLSNFFSFKDAKKNKFFTLSKSTAKSISSFVLMTGSKCESLKKSIERTDLSFTKSEYYPNGPKCDKAPCVSYSGTVDLE